MAVAAGQRLGRLRVARKVPRRWLCQCDCGQWTALTSTALKRARQCAVCSARDAVNRLTEPLLTQEDEMLFSLTISPAGAYLFTPQGGAPSPTPLWAANFITGIYEVAGSSVSVGDVFAENVDWGSFNPATDIDSSGLIGTPVLAGEALSSVLGGATYVANLSFDNAGSTRAQFDLLTLPDFGIENYVIQQRIENPSRNELYLNGATAPLTTATAGPHIFAMTISPTHLAISVDGGAVVQITGASPGAFTDFGINCSSLSPVASITAYPVQADADLPALSAP
jgi:hypothetical protein